VALRNDISGGIQPGIPVDEEIKLIPLASLQECRMEILGLILAVVGFIVVIVGGIWFLIVAFQESVLWGLGSLLFWPVSMVIMIMHWDEAGKPFLVQLAGAVPMFAGMMMIPDA